MVARAAGKAECESGSLFSRCRRPAIEICQYCGHDFCNDHTYFVENHNAVCTRKRCRRKHDDLDAYETYKTDVRRRNLVEHCGHPECRVSPRFECSFCKGHFCPDHLRDRQWGFRDEKASYNRDVSLCEHCWSRRKVWQ